MPTLTGIKTYALDLLFPPRCLGCAQEGLFLCGTCSEKLSMVPPSCIVCKKIVPARLRTIAGRTCGPCRKKSHIFAFFSPFRYEDPLVRSLIHNLKYQRVRDIQRILADLLTQALTYYGVSFPDGALVVPMPLAAPRRRVRGFNQTDLIAATLCSKLSLEQLPLALFKTKNTAPQMELAREARLTNLAGAFSVRDNALVRYKTILLLDDVKTTGATLEEAAKTLRHAGAKRIWAITVAH